MDKVGCLSSWHSLSRGPVCVTHFGKRLGNGWKFNGIHQTEKRVLRFTTRVQCCKNGECSKASDDVRSGSERDLDLASERVDRMGRRRALALSLAVPMASLDIGSHPARALIQTGTERGEIKAVGNAVENLKSRISTFTLRNGMQWIVLERHNAPVVACHTYANVGASCEVAGMTGLAHFLEHLAFKGTRLVGTRNPDKEATLLDQLDDVFYAMQEAKIVGKTAYAAQLNKK